jgi:hypothetical protein
MSMQRRPAFRQFLLAFAAILAGSVGISTASASEPSLIPCAEYQLIGKFVVADGSTSLEVSSPGGHELKIHFKKVTNQILLNGLSGFTVDSRVVITSKLGSDSYAGKLKTVTVLPDGPKAGSEPIHLINKSASCDGA